MNRAPQEQTPAGARPHPLFSPARWLTATGLFGLATLGLYLLGSGAEGEEIMGRPVGHWSSLLPPLIAIITAITFRSLVVALSAAFVLGAILTFGLSPVDWVPGAARGFLWENVSNQFQLAIFGFLFCLVGLIHVAYASGGIPAMVRALARLARGRRSAQGATFLAGLAVFFDDYSNTVVVGNSMRALTDRFRVSREKLAYLVDSTTAPIAGLALVSTWIAFEVFLLGSAAARAGIPLDGYAIFFQMLPFRFYCIGTLLFLAFTFITHREFGPMLRAERRALHQGLPTRKGARLLTAEHPAHLDRNEEGHWLYAAFPILLVIAVILGGILLIGVARHQGWTGEPAILLSMSGLRDAFGAAAYDPYNPDGPGVMMILFWAAFIGGVAAFILPVAGRKLSAGRGLRAYTRAVPTLWMAIFILTMAWSMKTICETLGTDTFLISLLGENLNPLILPLLAFLLAAAISFATGSSWATMGILIPVVLPLAGAMGLWHETTGGLLFFMTAAAILDGAIFGDHCSPISDTTVLSSIATHCDPVDHVTTQVAYALTVVVLACLLGYLGVAFGLPSWLYVPTFAGCALALLYFIGQNPEHPNTHSLSSTNRKP